MIRRTLRNRCRKVTAYGGRAILAQAVGCAVVLVAAKLALAAPVEGPLESVVFAPGDTIRGVAERYLKDADLWPQILELSGIASPAELRAGVELKIPVRAGRRRRRGARLLARRHPEGDRRGRAHLRARSRSARRSRTATPPSSSATSAPGPRW